jgi:ArsR family transcriptional regulator, virulence genes transcriptional regulator
LRHGNNKINNFAFNCEYANVRRYEVQLAHFTISNEDKDIMAEEASSLLLAMGNPKRLLILCNLLDGELNVNELAKRVTLNQAALSQHLAKLRALKLVATRREAQHIYYRLASEEVYEVLAVLNRLYCSVENGQKRAC